MKKNNEIKLETRVFNYFHKESPENQVPKSRLDFLYLPGDSL